MDFNVKLKNYAELICKYGLNIQEGQLLRLQSEAVGSNLAVMIAEQAYHMGAKYVDTKIYDPRFTRVRVESAMPDTLDFIPAYMPGMYDEFIENEAASCSLLGSFNPDELEGLPPEKINQIRMANYQAFKKFRDEGIEKGKIQWTLAAVATPGWAKKVFPDLSPEKGVSKLWEEIFKICRVDKENFLELWEEHDRKLKKRSAFLDNLKIKYLHFQGPGTDLKVFLTEKARFIGGRSKSSRGLLFEPNIPTEECFTTPDYRLTSGIVTATRPLRVNGTLVSGLKMEFKEGKLVNSSAETGHNTFQTYYQSDEGASRLGEVALVGIDSPIYQSGIVFDEVLLDENAACHIAIGSAYRKCIEGGTELKESELDDFGINDSSVHQDMMISSEDVSVIAHTRSDKEVVLIEKGSWNI